jgi:alanyl-tRNA synthetase
MDGNEIRRRFLRFFEERDHRILPCCCLISPYPWLLLTTAGMVQFTPYFLGLEDPPYPRVATVQKAFRTPDIENVGHTARHLTFFEMLGNFSFGDYFKREAIRYGHELVTEEYELDHDRLWVSVYETDDEAIELWVEEAGIPRERIVRRGKEDNYWSTHAAGPCGPSSEIFVDRGPKYGPEGGPAVDEDRFCEIWNLVFMQCECDDDENVLRDLPKQNIDTGSSLERVAMVVQGVDTVFETDLMRPLIEVGERVTGARYGADPKTDVALRVIAEHGRAVTFLMADGVLPSNEGRGYVLRRELRRLVTYGRRIGLDRPVMGDLVETTLELMGESYPELKENRAFILQVAASEEERFGATYRQGMSLFEEEVARAKGGGSGVLSGEAAFRLHDTFGFQEQLTEELAAEEGLTMDREAFSRLMEEQRTRARAAIKKGEAGEALTAVAAGAGRTEFVGYEHLDSEGRVLGLIADGDRTEAAGEGAHVQVVLDRTPFYAEGGGQVGDAGIIRTGGGLVRVTDTRPGPGGITVHDGIVESGEIREGEEAEARVDEERREATARSHTATHVLHHTIRQSLGEHARQAGSLVRPGQLRFDFSHFEAVPREALEEIEYVANERLAQDSAVRAYETTQDFARSQGAIALFGEKYGDIVRVVEVGDYSIELCGGTHVHHTGEVALLRVLGEASIGSGFRRIEALVGPDALKQVNVERRLLQEISEAVGAGDPSLAPERVRHVVARIRQLESELGKIRKAEQRTDVERLAAEARDVRGVKVISKQLDDLDANGLRELAMALRNQLANGPGAVVLATSLDGSALLVAALTNDLTGRGVTAASLLEPLAATVGGRAGGKPNLAMGGGPKGDAVPAALEGIDRRLEELLA